MSEKEIKNILENYKTISVVGLSRNPEKYSYKVARYLQSEGYNIVPVNPYANKILGKKCYKNLIEILELVEIIDIFRPSEQVLPIVKEAIELKKRIKTPRVIWMQVDIVNQKAARLAKNSNFVVVMNKCMMREHRHLYYHKK